MILEDLGHDLRYAARTLLRSPGFAAVAVLAIGLCIGANSAIFSVLNAVVLRPLPYHQPDRIVTVLHDGPRIPERLKRQCPVSPADYLDWRAQNQVFEGIAAAQAGANTTLSGRGQVETLKTMQVAPQLFPLLGVRPLLGRTFLPDEDRPGAGRVVVLSHGLWQRRFGADPALVGQTLTLDGDSHTVVGIMPPAFQFAPFWWTNAELWVPRFNLLVLNLFACLALILAAIGIYSMMAHAVSRRTRELGIRLALGASTANLHRLVVVHGMVLTMLGVAVGLVTAFATTRLMAALLFEVQATDPGTFAGIPLVLIAVGLVACYLPARRATRVDPIVALRQE